MPEPAEPIRSRSDDEPSLPEPVLARLFAILEHDEASWSAAFDRVCAEFPQHADAIQRWVPSGARTEGDRAPPRNVGRYRILRPLGQGGMGHVFLAEDPTLGRTVALKLIRPERLLLPAAKERFRREAKMASRLEHPGICAVYEVGDDRGVPFIAMRYVEGETLANVIARAPGARAARGTNANACDEPRSASNRTTAGPTTRHEVMVVVHLFEKIARALHAAHEQGLVHRDIKPGNVMVTRDGEPVLMDFGLAQDEASGEDSLTASGDLLGTPLYMSPEQIRSGGKGVDLRTDVYSLGVTLYEALTLQRPFDAPTREGIFRNILESAPPRPSRLNAQVPRDLAVVVATAIEKDRERRYHTALDLAEDLRRVRGFEPIRARPVGLGVRLRRWTQRNRLAAGLLVGLSMALWLSLWFAWVARVEGERATANYTRYQRLVAIAHVKRARDIEKTLYPAWPEQEQAMASWLADIAEPLAALLPDLRAGIANLAAEHSTDTTESYLRDTLVDLVRDVESITQGEVSLLASVNRRLDRLRWVKRMMEEHSAAWAAARAAIREHPMHKGLDLLPQFGLVPLGPDPRSQLWEFADLASAEQAEAIPARNDDGKLRIADGSGMVFVLLPGGKFWMGSGWTVPSRPNYVAGLTSTSGEGPPHVVEMDPCFVSKFELTQSQWIRLSDADENPSTFQPGRGWGERDITPRNPVEHVTWTMCDDLLRKHGLVLPTEAQWEYACRGGTKTPWSTGEDVASLQGSCNVSDRWAQQHAVAEVPFDQSLDDGHTVHAPVGSFLPNPFGLHDMHGNVAEWCLDHGGWYGRPLVPKRPGTGERIVENYNPRIERGGSFLNLPERARSGARNEHTPDYRNRQIGVRPARLLVRR